MLVCSSFEVHCIQPLLVVPIISTQRADGMSVSGTSFLVGQDVGLLFFLLGLALDEFSVP